MSGVCVSIGGSCGAEVTGEVMGGGTQTPVFCKSSTQS